MVVSPAAMESLITEPGPKNPLLFLSLSLVNRIPGYIPDEKETLNQLECLNDLISSVSVPIFRLESLKNPVAVAVDSLMSIAVVEAKKSVPVRVSALECLKLLLVKLVASGISSLIEIIPGILSKMVKISTGRVDVEVDRIIQLALDIIDLIICCFLKEQDQWVNTNRSDEEFVILKQKYRANIDMIVCSLRPIVKSRRASFYKPLFNILQRNLMNNSLSNSSIKLFLILISEDHGNVNINTVSLKKFVDIYNEEIVEWFDVNADNLKEIHEEILFEKVEIILGLINLTKNKKEFIIISDLFTIIKKLTELKVSTGGDMVSIEYSDESTSLSFNENLNVNFKIPKISFKTKLKISKEFWSLIEKLIEKMLEIDSKAVENLLMNFEDENIEELIQKIDLTSAYYKSKIKTVSALFTDSKTHLIESSLLKDCLKYFERSTIRSFDSQLIHLATLKLLLSTSELFPQIIRSNLLIILSGMTSEWIILKETSIQILRVVAKGQCSEYIKEHERFLLDRLGIQLALPAFYPESPQIISCLVRDILDPETALKFTDLLVRKVSDNLGLYQGYPAYCKDLLQVAKETIEVISKGKAHEFIDPKDFAFDIKTLDDDDNTESDATLPLNCQQRIIVDLLKIGINFIISDSKLIRSKSIDLITCSVINFTKYNKSNSSKNEPTEICQLIHQAWPKMIAVLKDSAKDLRNSVQLDVLVVESFASCSSILFEKLPLFMRDRFVKDFWRWLKTSSSISSISGTSCSMQITKLLLNTLNCGILKCNPSTEICLEILNYLSRDSSCSFDDEIFKSIWSIEPDLIWYFYSIELGGLDEINSPFPDLKSFKLKNKNIADNTMLKAKLKQFIIQ